MSEAASKILAEARNQSKTSYDDVKNTEAKVGGRMLPAGLSDAIGQITEIIIDKWPSGDPRIRFMGTTVEPNEYAKIGWNIKVNLLEDQFHSERENQETITSVFKMLGYEEQVVQHNDFFTMLADVGDQVDNDKPFCIFNTSRKTNKSGYANVFIQGIPDPGYQPSEGQTSVEGYKKPEGRPAIENKKTETKSDSSLKVGQKVKIQENYFDDGAVWEGEVKSVSNTEAEIFFPEDGATDTIPLSAITPVEEETKEESSEPSAPFEKDDAVVSTGDWFENGEDYDGVVLEVLDGECKVKFSDGEEQTLPFENLKPAT